MDATITQIKSWIFPSLVSILSLMIWHDVNEMKADVKQLIVQSNIDKTRIDNLERQVYKTGFLSVPNPPNKLPLQVDMRQVVAIRTDEEDRVYL